MPDQAPSVPTHSFSTQDISCSRYSLRRSGCAAILLALLLAPFGSNAWAAGTPADTTSTTPAASPEVALPDAPSATTESHSKSFAGSLGTAVRTIGEDEWNILKYPFQKKALVWDALALGATGVLIANDESVLRQVSPSWHNTSLNISDAGVYGLGAAAGGIFITGLITHNEHATDAGIHSAEASVDSVILYAALKAVLARQRPYMGQGEGRFFSGNWTSGSFPSGHATLAWTLASVIAHDYPNWPVRLLVYGAATAVSTTRVTGGVHFPSDVFAGSVIGYGVGTYVAHKDLHKVPPPHSQNRIKHLPTAILGRVAIQ